MRIPQEKTVSQKVSVKVAAAVIAVVALALIFFGWRTAQNVSGGSDVSKEYAEFYRNKTKAAPQNSPEAASPFYQDKRNAAAGH